jgi:hypothetical protein
MVALMRLIVTLYLHCLSCRTHAHACIYPNLHTFYCSYVVIGRNSAISFTENHMQLAGSCKCRKQDTWILTVLRPWIHSVAGRCSGRGEFCSECDCWRKWTSLVLASERQQTRLHWRTAESAVERSPSGPPREWYSLPCPAPSTANCWGATCVSRHHLAASSIWNNTEHE